MTFSRRRKGYRESLPTGDLRGQFFITSSAIEGLEHVLPTYRGVAGSHEGIAFLCGFEAGEATLLTTAIAPEADHGPGHVRCSEVDVAALSAAARNLGLGVLAQVHSHPSGLTGHSYGDDKMVFMPFESMLSIVVPDYGRFALRPIDSLGVHQFQDGQWVLVKRQGISSGIRVIPGLVDLR